MGKIIHSPVVTRSKSQNKTLSSRTGTTYRLKMAHGTSQTVDEQMKQLRRERENMEKQKADLELRMTQFATCQELADQVKMLQREKDQRDRASSSNNIELDIKAPKFSDEDKSNPIEFLRDLERYFNVHNVNDAKQDWVLGSILEGRAKIWYEANKEVCNTYENFRKHFKREFYSVQYQVKAKNRWSSRRYKSQDGELRSYFRRQSEEAKYFEPALSTYEINYAVVQQLPARIRDLLATIDFNNSELIMQSLSNLDISQEGREFDRDKTQNFNRPNQNRNQIQGVISNNYSRQSRFQSRPNNNYNNSNNYGSSYMNPTGHRTYYDTVPQQFILPNTRYPPPVLVRPTNYDNQVASNPNLCQFNNPATNLN
ncbi:uncharacterized protein LOC125500905 [Athalia rosae]|uniref:uncharacterized protein LOC125500905 n=1 Tax=Athalia rosae TaxID=37344 RepID=UPI002033AF46|nr:uncharacterized protein LOC125500905 [Athalia rosae]